MTKRSGKQHYQEHVDFRKQLHLRSFPRELYLGVSFVHASQSCSPHSNSKHFRELSAPQHEQRYQDTNPNRGRRAKGVLLPGQASRRGQGRQHQACAPALAESGAPGLPLIPPSSILVSQQAVDRIIKIQRFWMPRTLMPVQKMNTHP